MKHKKRYEVNFDSFREIGMIDPTSVITNQKAYGMAQLMKQNLTSFKKQQFPLDSDEEKFWLLSFALWNVENQYNSPLKFVAPVGSGKSTALEAFHIYMGRYSKDNEELGFSGNNWGSIVVKPHIEDCTRFADHINKEAGRNIAYAVFGSAHYLDTDTTQKNEWAKQEKYPVLVITQSMLRSLVLRGKLVNLTEWIDENGTSRRRTQLFVDERPVFKESFTLTPGKIERLNSLIHGLANRSNLESFYYTDFEAETRALVRELRKPKQARLRKLKPLFFDYELPQILQDTWDKNVSHFDVEDYQLLEQFVHIANNGGIIQVSDKGASVTGGWNVWKRANFMNVIILDGTGKSDPNYPKLLEDDKGKLTVEFMDFDMEPDREVYANLLINVNRKHNIGANWLNHDPELRLQKVVRLIKEIRKENHSLLVIGSKRMTDALNEQFPPPNYSLDIVNWSEARGKNDYRLHDAVLILGNIIRPGADYVVNVELNNPGLEVGLESSTSGGFHMLDPLAQEFSIKDRAIHLCQIIGRIRPYKSSTLKTVYMFSLEPKVVDFVENHFNGCRLQDWELPFSLTSEVTKKTSKELFIEWLVGFERSGEKSIKAKEVRENVLNVSRPTWNDIKNDEQVKEVMKKLGIAFKGQSIMKD